MIINFFAKNLKFLREKKGLKQAEMLANIGFKQTTWNNYEKGSSYPGFMDLIKIVVFFDVNIDDIINKDLSDTYKLIANEESAFYSGKSKPNYKKNYKLNEENKHNPGLIEHLQLDYERKCIELENALKTIEEKERMIRFLADHVETVKAALSEAKSRLEDPPRSKRKAG